MFAIKFNDFLDQPAIMKFKGEKVIGIDQVA
jgi:hypothetical protein